MKNIERYFLRKYSPREVEDLIECTQSQIHGLIGRPLRMIVFGSALTDHFDQQSDLDLVLIFPDQLSAKKAEKILYRNAQNFQIPIDFLCVDEGTHENKSNAGGVFWIAAREGREVS